MLFILFQHFACFLTKIVTDLTTLYRFFVYNIPQILVIDFLHVINTLRLSLTGIFCLLIFCRRVPMCVGIEVEDICLLGNCTSTSWFSLSLIVMHLN